MAKLLKFISVKPLTRKLRAGSGRSSLTGRITIRHRGGGHARRYRLVDFYRSLYDLPAYVLRVEKDPIRNAYIALICYANGVLSYILQPQNLLVGSLVLSSKDPVPLSIGNTLPLEFIPIGTFIHNVQLIPNTRAAVGRAAGILIQVLRKTPRYTLLRLPSTELRYVPSFCMATVGAVSNPLYKFTSLRKAGQSRWLGLRPSVRGVAMNPIDHPHGGGQGKTSGGRPSVSPWAIPTKGFKTVRKHKSLVFKARV